MATLNPNVFQNDEPGKWVCIAVLVGVLLCLTGVAGAQGKSADSAAALELKRLMGIAVAQDKPAESASAQDKSADSAAVQANNPLANFTAFNLHNYYIGKMTDMDDKEANQFWMRFAKPFSIGGTNWIMRASLPVNTFPVAPTLHSETGFGDLNVFAAYLFDTPPGVSFGLGPQITAPTASKDELGSEKWSPGLVNTLFISTSPKFQYGYLMSWQQSCAGDDDRADVNLGAFQPFLFYQLGGGTYLRSSAVMAFNLENGDYSIPLGLGIGQVIRNKGFIHNIFIEPQISVADEGPGWPQWQIFVGLNTQF